MDGWPYERFQKIPEIYQFWLFVTGINIQRVSKSFYILAYGLKLIVKSGDLEIYFFSKSGKFGSFFSMQKTFVCINQHQNFQVEIWGKFAQQEHFLRLMAFAFVRGFGL